MCAALNSKPPQQAICADGGRAALCVPPPADLFRGWHEDHDHQSLLSENPTHHGLTDAHHWGEVKDTETQIAFIRGVKSRLRRFVAVVDMCRGRTELGPVGQGIHATVLVPISCYLLFTTAIGSRNVGWWTVLAWEEYQTVLSPALLHPNLHMNYRGLGYAMALLVPGCWYVALRNLPCQLWALRIGNQRINVAVLLLALEVFLENIREQPVSWRQGTQQTDQISR